MSVCPSSVIVTDAAFPAVVVVPVWAPLSSMMIEATPQQISSAAKSTVTSVLFHIASFGSGAISVMTATEQAYAEARAQYPETTAEEGEHLFRAQNCGGCHGTLNGDQAPRSAPDLSIETARVRPDWLVSYLIEPQPILPSGSPVGSSARMPSFRLSDGEASVLIDQITDIAGTFDLPASPKLPPLSQFSMTKAHRLIEEQLPCLGCHRLGGEGGVIGPDLSSLANRLQPAFVQGLIEQPHALLPDTVMPRLGLLDSEIEAGRRVLAPTRPGTGTARLPGVPGPAARRRDGHDSWGAPLQTLLHCLPWVSGWWRRFQCRGLADEAPNFSDADYMSSRPDDTLFDGIAAGGRILGKSHHMPAWGGTLSNDDISALVRYLRVLGECEGPEWSRDGAAPDPEAPEKHES